MIVDRLKEDLKSAMKSGDQSRTGVLRMALAELHNRAKDKQAKGKDPVLTDEEAIEVLQKEFKRRKEANELFRKGGRSDLVEKEEKELIFFQVYLPEAAKPEEIELVVKEVVAVGNKDFGLVMKEAAGRLKGRADGKQISEAVKKLLG